MPDTTAPVLTPTEARQASPRRLNLHVLIWSMLLAVVAAAVLYYGVYAKPDSSIGLPKEQPASTAPRTGNDGARRARDRPRPLLRRLIHSAFVAGHTFVRARNDLAGWPLANRKMPSIEKGK